MSDRPENLSASEALQRLKDGNARYVAESMERPNSCGNRRAELVGGQRPFATVVTCADSRVPPELVFDQGLGDVFVIRVAGNIAEPGVLGSIEYASLHLGVNLVVVMGHQSCGAVGATVDNADFDGPATHSNIDAIIEAIRPPVRQAKEHGTDDLVERSVRENARYVAGQIRSSDPVLKGLAAKGLAVQPAYYKLDGGAVEWLDTAAS